MRIEFECPCGLTEQVIGCLDHFGVPAGTRIAQDPSQDTISAWVPPTDLITAEIMIQDALQGCGWWPKGIRLAKGVS